VRPGPDGVLRADSGRPDPAPLTTIAWRVCHIAIDLLDADRNATWLGVVPIGLADGDPPPGTAEAALDRLERAYQRYRDHVSAMDAATLADPMGEVARMFANSTRAAFVLHELDELIHHGAEVALMRDLYRAYRPQ
jgi:hypothetical protein